MTSTEINRLTAAVDRLAAAVERLAGRPASEPAPAPTFVPFGETYMAAVPLRHQVEEHGVEGAVFHAAFVFRGRLWRARCGAEKRGPIAITEVRRWSEARKLGFRTCRSKACRP